MIRSFGLVLYCLVIVLGSSSSFGSEPLAIEWKDLRPRKTFQDAFEKLTDDQLRNLAYATRIRSLIAANKLSADGRDAKDATEIEQRLTNSGIDVEYLVSLRAQVQRIRVLEASATQAELIGKEVAFDAFVVPLKQAGAVVTECFLVGSFDACTHSAPPPANQTIFLRSTDGFALRNLKSPIHVTGRLQAQQTTRLRPGSTSRVEMSAAYSITDHQIEPFEHKPDLKLSRQ